MSLYLDTEGEVSLPFDAEETAKLVTEAALDLIGCPYEAEVDLLITHDAQIREMNREHRGIDRATDVLSFPFLDFAEPGDFSGIDEETPDVFHPETGELLLGDIVLSVERIMAQAEEYGHSPRREFAFLIAHSMLHLFGFDHMEEEERSVMERKQREIMERVKISRSDD